MQRVEGGPRRRPDGTDPRTARVDPGFKPPCGFADPVRVLVTSRGGHMASSPALERDTRCQVMSTFYSSALGAWGRVRRARRGQLATLTPDLRAAVLVAMFLVTFGVLGSPATRAHGAHLDAGGSQGFCVCNCTSTIFVDQGDCGITGDATITVTVICNGVQCGTATETRRCIGTDGVVVFCANECGGKGHCWYPCDPKTWGTVGPNLTGLCHACTQPGKSC